MPRLNQKGVIQLIPLLLLLAGIIAGIYLVQTRTNLLPKAYQINLPSNQYDEPPPLVTSTSKGAQGLLKDAAIVVGYSVTFNETEEEIILDFEPQDLTEDVAKELLNRADVYYLKTIKYILEDSWQKIVGPPIDPWYAMCDHLPEDLLIEKVGAEPTYLKGEQDGQEKQLACTDQPPSRDQFKLTDSHVHWTYKKIPASLLISMVETTRLERENKNLQQNAFEFALSLTPILGPMLTVSAADDPNKIAQATVINGLLTVITGPGTPVGQAAAKVTGVLISPLKNQIVTIYVKVKGGAQEVIDNLNNLNQQLTARLIKRTRLTVRLVATPPGRTVVSKESIEAALAKVPEHPLFGKYLDEGGRGVTYLKNGIVTKISKIGFVKNLLNQIDILKKVNGRYSLPKYYGEIVDPDGNVIGFTQEFIEGLTLEEFIRQGGKISMKEAGNFLDDLVNLNKLVDQPHGAFHPAHIIVQVKSHPDGTKSHLLRLIDYGGEEFDDLIATMGKSVIERLMAREFVDAIEILFDTKGIFVEEYRTKGAIFFPETVIVDITPERAQEIVERLNDIRPLIFTEYYSRTQQLLEAIY